VNYSTPLRQQPGDVHTAAPLVRSLSSPDARFRK
jgi:hypothetical protein